MDGFSRILEKKLSELLCTRLYKQVGEFRVRMGSYIPNGCLDAYEVKVNIDIFKYQEKVKLISQFQRFFSFFNGLLEFASLP